MLRYIFFFLRVIEILSGVTGGALLKVRVTHLFFCHKKEKMSKVTNRINNMKKWEELRLVVTNLGTIFPIFSYYLFDWLPYSSSLFCDKRIDE